MILMYFGGFRVLCFGLEDGEEREIIRSQLLLYLRWNLYGLDITSLRCYTKIK